MIKPGDLIEWWCKHPFKDENVPYTRMWFFVSLGGLKYRSFPTSGTQLVVGVDDEHITWLNGEKLYSERLSDLIGGFENLTGSVHVFPRAMQT